MNPIVWLTRWVGSNGVRLPLMVMSVAWSWSVVAQTSLAYVTNVSGGDEMVLRGEYVYLAHKDYNATTGLGILDISNPALPIDVGYQDGDNHCLSVSTSGGRAAALYYGSLRILSLANPTNPVVIGRIDGFSGIRLTASGNNVLVGMGEDYIQVFDIGTDGMPIARGQIEASRWALFTVGGHHAFVADGPTDQQLSVWDIADPTHPVKVAQLPSSPGSVMAIETSGNLLCVSTDAKFVQHFMVYDISNPVAPVAVSDQPWAVQSIKISGNYAYLGMNRRLGVAAISAQTNAVLLNSIESPGWWLSPGRALAVSNGFAYILGGGMMGVYSIGREGPPPLRIRRAGVGDLWLGWPAPTGAFALQQNTDLNNANWVTLPLDPVWGDSENQVVVPTPPGTTFYRLVAQ